MTQPLPDPCLKAGARIDTVEDEMPSLWDKPIQSDRTHYEYGHTQLRKPAKRIWPRILGALAALIAIYVALPILTTLTQVNF